MSKRLSTDTAYLQVCRDHTQVGGSDSCELSESMVVLHDSMQVGVVKELEEVGVRKRCGTCHVMVLFLVAYGKC